VQPADKALHGSADPQNGVSNVDRAQKRQLVTTLNDAWKSAGVIVVAHYKGMTVAQMTDFRKRMKEAGGAVKVAKNKLAKLALKDTEVETVSDLLNGQTCIAYSDDPISAARVSVKYAKENEKLVILGGAMGKTRLDTSGVQALADLPSLDELRAKLLGLFKAPAEKLVRTLNEPAAKLTRVMQARVDKEGQAA
jgi:large subunit ribosomal protein L10